MCFKWWDWYCGLNPFVEYLIILVVCDVIWLIFFILYSCLGWWMVNFCYIIYFSFWIGDRCDFWLCLLCNLWCDKFLYFDRRVKFWFVLDSKSVDFTGVLLDWWVVNRLVLMCYFFIKYGVFGWVREKLYFQGFDGIFEWYVVVFGVVGMGENGVKWSFCRTHYRTRKWGFRRENIRYAVLDFRLHVLKCKPRPHHGIKSYYNSTVLWYVCSWFVAWFVIADPL